MSSTMSMNLIIHAAIRRDIKRFGAALDNFPAGSSERAGQLANAWKFLGSELRYHHHSEDELFFPAFAAVGASKDLLAEMDAEHHRLADAVGGCDTAFAALATSPSETNAAAARAAIGTLSGTVEAHFSHEERDLEPVLTANLDAPPVKEAVKKVQRSRNPVAGGQFMAWLADGAGEPEKTALAETIPGPVRYIFGNVVGRGYNRVAATWKA
jgi:hemerythrin-like domain-containing protein